MTQFHFHYIKVSAANCVCRAFLNGFPLDHIVPAPNRPPLRIHLVNQLLVGPGNVLRLELEPLTREQSNGRARVAVDVEAHTPDDPIGPEPGGRPLLHLDNDAFSELELPTVLEARFDSQGPRFRQHLCEGPIIDDPSKLLAWTMDLRHLLASARIAEIVERFAPKLDVFAHAYERDPDEYRAKFARFVSQRLAPDELLLDFAAEDLRVRPHCGGRVWEVGVGRGRDLVQTREDESGRLVGIPVFVGLDGGQLAIVR